jgi:hypothetical protein
LDHTKPEYAKQKYWYKERWNDALKDAKGTTSTGSEDHDDTDPHPIAPGKQKGNVRAAKGINVTARYLQKLDGSLVDGHRTKYMRKKAMTTFGDFEKEGRAPDTWGGATAAVQSAFYGVAEETIPEFAYCANHWKAEEFAKNHYPSFKSNKNPNKRQKMDTDSPAPDDPDDPDDPAQLEDDEDSAATGDRGSDTDSHAAGAASTSRPQLDTSQVCSLLTA